MMVLGKPLMCMHSFLSRVGISYRLLAHSFSNRRAFQKISIHSFKLSTHILSQFLFFVLSPENKASNTIEGDKYSIEHSTISFLGSVEQHNRERDMELSINILHLWRIAIYYGLHLCLAPQIRSN
jgi:hypothetical protein